MKIPNKFKTEGLPDNFKKQAVQTLNDLIDCVKELKKEVETLKKSKL